jgi:hypothetical protein
VDSTGLADAAVATGAVDIPLKLPAPEVGTAEQAGPKSVSDVLACEAVTPAAGAWAAAEDEPPELHAAVPRARPAASAGTARTRGFTISPSARSGKRPSIRSR